MTKRLIKTRKDHRKLRGVISENTIALTLSPAAGALSPGGQVGVAYTRTFTVSNGIGPTVGFAVSAGALPPGLSLNGKTGVLSGTPAVASQATYNFTLRGSDEAGNSGTAAYSLVIAAA